MIQTWRALDQRLRFPNDPDPLFIIPTPTPSEGEEGYSAGSVDLRLGTWFLVARQTKVSLLEIDELSSLELRLKQVAAQERLKASLVSKLKKGLHPDVRDNQLTKLSYVRFGQDFILHPRSFALAVTLEWLRIPRDLAGYVTTRSSWGRRGLNIATAIGVHPGFVGCLTLELANVGDIPIAIRPGMSICQLFLHSVNLGKKGVKKASSSFSCRRLPAFGSPTPDKIAIQLARGELTPEY